MIRHAFSLLSPGGRSAKLSIFIFHRVLASHDPLLEGEPDVARFTNIVRFLSRAFNVIPLNKAVDQLRDSSLPPASACITFDDGYADNLNIAAPILCQLGVTATFFISTGYIDGGRMWNDSIIESIRLLPDGRANFEGFGLGCHELGNSHSRRAAIARILNKLKYFKNTERLSIANSIARETGLSERSDLMLTRDGVCKLKQLGMEIGAHTVTHPILTSLDDDSALFEIHESRRHIQEWTGEAPTLFAYPNGIPGKDFSDRDEELVKLCGFTAAVSTMAGVSTRKTNPYQLMRFTPWDKNMIAFAARSAKLLAGF